MVLKCEHEKLTEDVETVRGLTCTHEPQPYDCLQGALLQITYFTLFQANVPLGKPASWHSYECCFLAFAAYLNCFAYQSHPQQRANASSRRSAVGTSTDFSGSFQKAQHSLRRSCALQTSQIAIWWDLMASMGSSSVHREPTPQPKGSLANSMVPETPGPPQMICPDLEVSRLLWTAGASQYKVGCHNWAVYSCVFSDFLISYSEL